MECMKPKEKQAYNLRTLVRVAENNGNMLVVMSGVFIMNKVMIFIRGLFEDSEKEPCIGRFSLFLGMILTVFTGVWAIDTVGEVTLWEAVVRTSPALIGLVAYIATRLFECKEFIAETAEKLKKK